MRIDNIWQFINLKLKHNTNSQKEMKLQVAYLLVNDKHPHISLTKLSARQNKQKMWQS